MRTIKISLLGLFLIVSASSCIALKSVTDHVDQIHPGMTMANVRQVLGKPDYMRFSDGHEQWEFRTTYLNGDMDVVIVNFRDGRVVGMDSFLDKRPVFPNVPDKK